MRGMRAAATGVPFADGVFLVINPDRFQRILGAIGDVNAKSIDRVRHAESIYLVCEEASLREGKPQPYGSAGVTASLRSPRGTKNPESRKGGSPSSRVAALTDSEGV
jgi:hypothetical protein